jgi:hypothetical protein
VLPRLHEILLGTIARAFEAVAVCGWHEPTRDVAPFRSATHANTNASIQVASSAVAVP